MSESDGCDFDCTCTKCKGKGKKRVMRIAETSDSDSPVENAAKRKKVLRVMSDGAASSSDSDSVVFPARKRTHKRAPRVESDDCSSPAVNRTSLPAKSDEDSSPARIRKKRSAATAIPNSTDTESENNNVNGSFGNENLNGLEEEEEEEGHSGSEEDETDEDYDGSSSSSGWESDWASHNESEFDIEDAESNSPPAEDQNVVEVPTVVQPANGGFESDSSSSDGQSERCPICLRSFGSQEVGTPASCDHSFCAICLQEWAKNVNTCPVDRQAFTLITIRRRLGGKIIREIPVEPPRVPDDDEEEILEDPTFCELCNRSDGEDRMLLCDGCDSGYHLDCLTPPLETVPIEQWFCPDCVATNSEQISGESGIAEGELMDLIEDAHEIGSSPIRPRVHRLLPRTRQSERVRATIRTRVESEAVNQPSTSSGIDSQGSASRFAFFFGGSVANAKSTEIRKRKKKKTKAKTCTRSKTTAASSGTRKKSSTTATGKKRKKRKSKRKYVKRRRTRRVPRAAAPKSVKSRLADQLGIRAPKIPGQMLPRGVKKKGSFVQPNTSLLGSGPLTLHILGQPNQLEYFASGSDEEGTGAIGGSAVSAMRRPRTSAARNERNLVNRKLLSPGAVRSHAALRLEPAIESPCDLISGILDSQAMWHSKKAVVSINRDRSFTVKKDSPRKSVSSVSRQLINDNETPSATSDLLPSRDAPVNVNDTPITATQAPMYPDRRGGSGGSRPQGGFNDNSQHYGDSAYRGGGYQNQGGAGRGPSSFGGPRSGFDFHDSRAGYNDFLQGGPTPFQGSGPPVRFRMPTRVQLRPTFPRRSQPQRPPENINEEQGWKSNTEDDDNEEEEIDIYSDIEVAGVEPEEAESLEPFPGIPPPPFPPMSLVAACDQGASDDDSDTELIIDDNIPQAVSPVNPVAQEDKYDPAEPCDDSNSNSIEETPSENKVESIALPPAVAVSVDNNKIASPSLHYDSSNSMQEGVVSKAVKEVLKVHMEASSSANEAPPGSDEDEDEEECPNFSIYSAVSMDIARNTDSDPVPENTAAVDIPNLDVSIVQESGEKVAQVGTESVSLDLAEKERDSLSASPDDNANSVASESSSSNEGDEEDESKAVDLVAEAGNDESEKAVSDHEDISADVLLLGEEVKKNDSCSLLTVDGLNLKAGLGEDIFASDEESLVGGATSPVSATSSAHTPTYPRQTGLEGLETEAISETEEATHFDDLSETSFATVDEDGEIPSISKRKRKKENATQKGDDKSGNSSREMIDYEEGEIVDERPKTDGNKESEILVEKEMKVSDENTDVSKKPSKGSEDDKSKKRKKVTEKRQLSKDRSVLSSKENKEKTSTRDRSSKDDPNISWKKPSKAKERNYRDGKDKVEKNVSKEKEPISRKRPSSKEKDRSTSRKDKDRRKKDKRQDMERYNVRKMVDSKKRSRRRDEFGRDLSRDRSNTRTRSRSATPKTRRRSRTNSKDRNKRASRKSPVKTKKKSRSKSKGRSRTKSRHRSRSRSPKRNPRKSDGRAALNRSRSLERAKRYSPVRPTRKRTRTRSRNRSRIRSRSRSFGRSRKDLDRPKLGFTRPPNKRRSVSPSWTPSWSRSGSYSRSSLSSSPASSHHKQFRSFSRSLSRTWTPEAHISVINKSSGNINKNAKKLTVTVSNTKEAKKKKKEKKKKILKKKTISALLEKRKKRKDKSPAPSKEVFTSGDNILVSVNFNKSSKQLSKDAANVASTSEASKRKIGDDANQDPAKKLRKDKGKDKPSPKLKGIQARLGAKKTKKQAPKLTRVQAAAKRKPMAIIDLDQSPFREQTPSPADLIVLSDSDDEAIDKQAAEAAERRARENSNSPKGSSKTGTNTATNVSESQSPIMGGIGSYLVTSTGPKTPPEPQIKFSIAPKVTLRSIMNPLQEEEEEEEEEDDLRDDVTMDNIDIRIEEELNRNLNDSLHKGPNTPPERRGPSTPCFSPSSPDAYDPFDPTKSNSPSPTREDNEVDRPSSVNCPIVDLTVGRDSAVPSDREEAVKAQETNSATVPAVSAESVKSPVVVTADVPTRSPVVVHESPLLLAQETQNSSQDPTDVSDKSKPSPIVVINSEPVTISPERPTSVVQTPPKPSPVKPIVVKSAPISQQPILTVPTHVTVASPVFSLLTSANIANMLRAPPPSAIPARINMFSQPPPIMTVPQLLGHHHLQHQFLSSPVIPQRLLPAVVEKPKTVTLKTTPLKLSPQKATMLKLLPPKGTPLRALNGDQKAAQDKSTDVVDMELESPYSPASSEANDLFNPPIDASKHSQRANPLKKHMLHKSPLKAGKDQFDTIFGASPLTKGKRVLRTPAKHQLKNNKSKPAGKHDSKGKPKKEIGIKMNEDKLQILDELPSSAVELQVKDKYLKKLNRQERVVEEVKLSLKPHYAKKHVTKEEYKDILRRSVPKICHNRSGEINPIKIASLVEAYVKKARYNKKKPGGSAKKGKMQSSWS